jgi:pimeloyl-ACP methyl ester carboxylesterase
LSDHFSEQYTLNMCDLWNVPTADPKENEAVVSDIPTLIFSGRYDPITPPKWAELVAETLSASFYYEFPNMPHGVMRSNSCTFQMGLAFLDDPLRAPESTYMNDLESVEFR